MHNSTSIVLTYIAKSRTGDIIGQVLQWSNNRSSHAAKSAGTQVMRRPAQILPAATLVVFGIILLIRTRADSESAGRNDVVPQSANRPNTIVDPTAERPATAR